MMQLDHLNLYVSDVPESRKFYELLLPPAGLPVNRDSGEVAVGFGDKEYAVLALVRQESPVQATHVAFRVATRAEVDELYDTALKAGGVDNGPPGLRPHYHENYYAAFIRDRDGHNLEFVCHNSQE
jgi:catechol 2,3-dioxygenase-like lactoylglutathione lyase family enzyme